jgi:TPR repeat protein
MELKHPHLSLIFVAGAVAAACNPAADAPEDEAHAKRVRPAVAGPLALGVVPLALPEDRLPADLAARGFSPGVGLLMGYVYRDGPAARAGLQRGSILLALNDEPVGGDASLPAVLSAFRAGDTITAKAWQGGLLRELKITAEDDLTVFSRACEQGDALGCFEAGARLEARGTTSGDAAEAVSFFERGCDGGAASACVNLGNAYSNGELLLGKDLARAATLYERACGLQVPAGCFNLARLHSRQECRVVRVGAPRKPLCNLEKASDLYGRVCKLGNPEACYQAGYFSESDETSAEYYQAACELGNQSGCELAEHKLDRIEQNRLRQTRREQACEGGEPEACSLLSTMYAKGSEVPRDIEKAIALATGACSDGFEFACRQALWYRGMTCVWTYKVAGKNHVDGSEARDVAQCARDAADHVRRTCAAPELAGKRVSGSAVFGSERHYSSLRRTCAGPS